MCVGSHTIYTHPGNTKLKFIALSKIVLKLRTSSLTLLHSLSACSQYCYLSLLIDKEKYPGVLQWTGGTMLKSSCIWLAQFMAEKANPCFFCFFLLLIPLLVRRLNLEWRVAIWRFLLTQDTVLGLIYDFAKWLSCLLGFFSISLAS